MIHDDERELEDLTDVELDDATDLSDEDEVAYDDGKDISEGAGARPEAGVVPDNPGEE